MRFFDRLTGAGVDWQIELASPAGAFRPGDDVAGRVRYTPKGNMQPRSIRVALTGSEHYAYLERERGSSVSIGSRRSSVDRSEWEREWYHDALFHQEAEVSGPTQLSGGTPGEFGFQFRLPPDALPSFDSSILRLRWQVRAWMDVGGRDPSTERDIYVIGGGDRLNEPEQALAPTVTDMQANATIYVEPLPLVAGQLFRGYVESPEQLDVGSTRVELKQQVATTGARGGIAGDFDLSTGNLSLGGRQRNTSEDRVLWAGPIAPMGAGPTGQRYQFQGQLPLAPIGTVTLPHGDASALIDIVISRRLVPDRHIARPVAIVTG